MAWMSLDDPQEAQKPASLSQLGRLMDPIRSSTTSGAAGYSYANDTSPTGRSPGAGGRITCQSGCGSQRPTIQVHRSTGSPQTLYLV